MKSIRAVYEDGVFKPTEPVDLPEHCPVNVEPMSGKAEGAASIDAEEFWKEKTIDQLAEEQGIGAVTRWAEVFGAARGLWRSDEEFDEFLNAH